MPPSSPVVVWNMQFLSRLLNLRRNLFAKSRVKQDMGAELHAYLDQLTDQHRAAGMALTEARREAQIEMGGIDKLRNKSDK